MIDDGTFVVVGAGKGSTPTAMVVTGSTTTSKARPVMPSVPINPKMPGVPAGQHATLTDALDEMKRVPGSETVITAGVYRGKTYGHMLHRTDYYALNVKNKNKSKVFPEFRAWVERFHEIDRDGIISIRDTPLASTIEVPSSSTASQFARGSQEEAPSST